MAVLSLTFLAAFSLASLQYGLYVALGLGLVIFFHELGHFAVAKWCNVNVERFSIGFGPILWSRKIGETEYALSALPFGGYVKMLGQDDMDPSQLSSEEIARNPRSYSAKSVPQRMAIISAGVIMNILTAVIFFGIAFGMGIKQDPAIVGTSHAGKPAWVAGIRPGDKLTAINGRQIDSFRDVIRGVALSSGPVRFEGVHADGETFDYTLEPDKSGTTRIVGLSPPASLTLRDFGPDKTVRPVLPGTPAAEEKLDFQSGDTILSVDGEKVNDYFAFQSILAHRRNEPLEMEVRNKQGEVREVKVPANPFRNLGLWMDIGRIVAVQAGSPADKAGLQVGDKIARVEGLAVGTDLNPVRLPDHFADLHGKTITVIVSREVKGAESKEIPLEITPDDRPGWTDEPLTEDAPLSIPSIGVAFHIIPWVLKVDPGTPADKAKILPRERIKSIEFLAKEGETSIGYGGDAIVIPTPPKKEGGPKRDGGFWAYAFYLLQELPNRSVKLTVSDEKGAAREVVIEPGSAPADDWYSPDRGFLFAPQTETLTAKSLGHAVTLGMNYTRNSIMDIYMTLRNLLTGNVSPRELNGPVQIAKYAYIYAKQGFADFSLFLGLLSVNLAVINFLPIPVLDGGHMVFLTWEAVTRKKPSERVLIAAQYVGIAFVLSLMVFVLYLDIFEHPLRK